MTYRFNILEKEDILDSIIQPLTLFIWFGIHNLKKKRNYWLRKPHKVIIFCQFTLLEIYYIKHPRPQTMEMDEPVNKCQLGNNEDQWMLLSLKFLKYLEVVWMHCLRLTDRSHNIKNNMHKDTYHSQNHSLLRVYCTMQWNTSTVQS